MGVRFLIGRAGTGKTAACADQIRAAMARDPLGGALLWLTPQQATFTAERMLLTAPGAHLPHGSFRAQVLSFNRLALLIAQQLHLVTTDDGDNARPMDEVARIVLLEETVRKHRSELQLFSVVANRPGFVQKLDATLRELRQNGHTGASLRLILQSPSFDAVTTQKLADLAVLLDAWDKVVGSVDSWDLEKVMHEATLALPKAPLITDHGGARVWVDAFSAMNALELDLLVALSQHAQAVTITLLADPESAPIKELRAPLSDTGLFSRTERLHRQLVDAFRKAGVRIDGTDCLRTPHRFTVPAIRLLEQDLFADRAAMPPAAGPKKPARANVPATPLFDEPAETPGNGGVELWECSDPETEVRVAAQAIRDLVTRHDLGESTLRYRQIGLIVPDLEGYQDALRRIFSEHHIPHFIDQRRSIAHHPLVEFLRSAVAIITSRWGRDELLLYLKTSLAGVSEDDVALVENYLLAHGIDRVPWSLEWRWVAPNQINDEDAEIPESARQLLARVNTVRQKVFGDLRDWVGACENRNDDAAAWVRGLRNLLARLNVEDQINQWIAAARGTARGDAELTQIHEQTLRQIQDLLTMLEGLLASRPRTLDEFERLLGTALENLTLGLIPPTVDQVLISSVTRSRVPELEVVIILGAAEGQFPKVIPEDPILSDLQRETINARSLSPIGLGSDRQLLEMPFYDYVAFTRARKQLFLSYPLADRRGKAIGKSRYLARLQELLGNTLVERRFDPASCTSIDRIGALDDLLTGVATWTRDVIRRRRETLADLAPPQDNAARTALYNWLVTAPDVLTREARQLVWSSIRPTQPPHLSENLARRFYPPAKALQMSVSRLETFAACPLQYFANYAMGLRQRPELELEALDMGILYHRILERFFQKIIDKELPWPDCDQATLQAVLEKEVDAASHEIHEELAQRTPAYDQMRARTKRTLGIVLEAQRRRAAQGDLRPVGVEVTFGMSAKSSGPRPKNLELPVLRIATPAGHAVELGGKIDRVDASHDPHGKHVAVIDYKSSSRRTLDLYGVCHGLELQLPVYALVVQDLLQRDPVAAFYLPLGLSRKSEKDPAHAPAPGTDAFFQLNPPRGIIDAGGANHLDNTVTAGEGKSSWYKIGYTAKGPIDKRSDMLTHADFSLLLNYVRWKIGLMTDDLMRGSIAPAPYRDGREIPCDDCDFLSLCPFDRATGTYRNISKLPRDQALARMREELKAPAP